MKIILAPDKFKNALTGIEFCNAVEAGIHVINPDIEIIKLPLADGGDGTIEVVNYYLSGTFINIEVNNPFFKAVQASYLFAESSKTACIEMAEASGLKTLKREQLDCKNATTYGTGEIIINAIERGVETIILGIGGSATNDCGIGMATALGYRFLNKNDKEVIPIGANLSKIVTIDATKVHSKIKNVKFKIACDVTNPLFGKNGAAYVYGSQKGASKEDIEMLDEGLKSFSKVIQEVFNVDAQLVKGAGAAGGMGIAAKVFLNGTLERGVDLIKELAQFDEQLADCNWIITGEGRLDTQTMYGKTIQGVLASAKAKQVKVAAFCGSIDIEDENLQDMGIHYADAVMNYAKTLNDAIMNSSTYLKKIALKFAETLDL